MEIISALGVTIRVTTTASLMILLFGLPMALYLARSKSRTSRLVEAGLLFPLLMPPTVLGYILLKILGRGSPVVEFLGIQILFTGWAASIAGFVVGLPLMVLAAKAAIAAVDPRLEEAARTLGASEFDVLKDITFPLAGRGIVAGLVLATARVMGEFGATLMVSGSLPGRTRTLPIALYESIQVGREETALGLTLILVALILVVLVLLHSLEGGIFKWRH
jgi:molybdate transport system permease protein